MIDDYSNVNTFMTAATSEVIIPNCKILNKIQISVVVVCRSSLFLNNTTKVLISKHSHRKIKDREGLEGERYGSG